MREYKSLVIALIAAVSAVVCVSIFTGGLLDYKKTGGEAESRPPGQQAVILNLT